MNGLLNADIVGCLFKTGYRQNNGGKKRCVFTLGTCNMIDTSLTWHHSDLFLWHQDVVLKKINHTPEGNDA